MNSDRNLAAKRRDAWANVSPCDAQAGVSALEREIDELVYALYGLTAEEIKMVEEASR
jgi:hypothetical protein